MTPELAEVQAEALTEAFKVNLEDLVTKDFLAVQLAAFESRMDARFAEMKAEFDSKFRTLYLMFSIIMVAVVLPYLERILAL